MAARSAEALLGFGFIGIMATLYLGFQWAPSVSIDAFESPAAQRIFYWHVPAAWAAFIAFGVLFLGSLMWFFKRSPLGWRLHVAGAEAGLACGLITVWSGCVWGAAEWGTPWDWTDVRLNTFGLLTLLALFLVLGRQSQPDGIETRDTFSTFGLYGFVLGPADIHRHEDLGNPPSRSGHWFGRWKRISFGGHGHGAPPWSDFVYSLHLRSHLDVDAHHWSRTAP